MGNTILDKARSALEILDVDITFNTHVWELEIGDQQLTELAKIIAYNVYLSILTNPHPHLEGKKLSGYLTPSRISINRG